MDFLKRENYLSLIHLLNIQDSIRLEFKNEIVILNYKNLNDDVTHVISLGYDNKTMTYRYSKYISKYENGGIYIDSDLNKWKLRKTTNGFYIVNDESNVKSENIDYSIDNIYFEYSSNVIHRIYTKDGSHELKFYEDYVKESNNMIQYEFPLVITFPIYQNKIYFADDKIIELSYQDNRLKQLIQNNRSIMWFNYLNGNLFSIKTLNSEDDAYLKNMINYK
jgi:hypothetical protein